MGVSPPFQLPGWCWNVWPGNPSATCLVGFRDGHLSAFSSAFREKNTQAEKNKGNGKVICEIFVHGGMNDHPRNQWFLTFLSLRVLGWRIYTFETHTSAFLTLKPNQQNKYSWRYRIETFDVDLHLFWGDFFCVQLEFDRFEVCGFGLVFVVGTGTDVFFPRKRGSSLISQPSNLKNWDYVNHHDLFLKASFPWG